jgi:hypothetical protein
VLAFDTFTADNDPYGEPDFGSLVPSALKWQPGAARGDFPDVAAVTCLSLPVFMPQHIARTPVRNPLSASLSVADRREARAIEA